MRVALYNMSLQLKILSSNVFIEAHTIASLLTC